MQIAELMICIYFFLLILYVLSFYIFQNALTHKKIFGNGPNSIEASWTAPPGISGDVTFYATVALNGGIFWVEKVTENLTIS